MKTIDEVAEIGYGVVMAAGQATSRVYEALSEANDGHGGNVEGIAASPAKKSKTLRRHYLKVKRDKRRAAFGLTIPDGKTSISLLERIIPSEFKEDLL